MSDSGWTFDPSQLSSDAPDLIYDSGSTGGQAGDTGAPSSSFDIGHTLDALSQGATTFGQFIHGLGGQTNSSAPASQYAPPASSGPIEPVTVTPAQTLPSTPGTTPQWVADLTDFTKPAPYIALVALVLFMRRR